MAELKGSNTAKNLWTAFAGESQARNKYTYYASVARREGYEQIAALFLETAENEREHAKVLLKLLGGIGTTAENLAAAAAGENYEWTTMYRQFAEEARAEGFGDIADVLGEIAEVEEEHEQRFLALLENIKQERVFSRPEPVDWKCRNCGYVHHGTTAPELCPACAHPQAHYELRCKPY
jgi:rubrerythrin